MSALALLAVLAPALTPSAAHAVASDVAIEAIYDVSGNPGTQRRVGVVVSNQSWDEATAAVTVLIAVTGSTVTALEPIAGATCDAAALACHFPAGLAPGSWNSIDITLTLGVTGTFTAQAVLSSGDSNPANDVRTAPITVAVPAPTALTLSTPPKQPLASGTQTALNATMTDAAGAPLRYTEIALLRQEVGAAEFVEVDRSYTGELGVATFTITPTATATYVARYAYTPSYLLAAADSLPVSVRVMYAVTAKLSPVTVPPGSAVTLTIGAPAAPVGTAVTVQQRVGTGTWVSISQPAVKANGTVTVPLKTTVAKVGAYTFRAIRGADASHDQGIAETKLVVTTTGRGNAAAWRPIYGNKTRLIRWNPCTPIPYYVNTRRMPSTGLADVHETVRRVSMVSGLTFKYAGRSTVIPDYNYLGPRGGIVFAWATATETKGLIPSNYVAGVGSSTYIGRRVIGGHVVINSTVVNEQKLAAGFGEGYSQGKLLMHELGHVVGLDHNDDVWSVMRQGHSLPSAVWGAADIAGLRALGKAGGCL
ncbi:MAG: hypothetical protein ABIM89_14090 [Mycobacteriales bacterium]